MPTARLTKDEWEYYRAALDSENGMLAIRLGGTGDMTEKAVKWKYQRSVPQLPSPLVFSDVLYMVNDNGIVTTLQPETGEVIKQGRLTGAPASARTTRRRSPPTAISSSPASAACWRSWDRAAISTPLVVNDLGENIYATPALADGRIYIRTTEALYAFGK